MLSMKSMLLCSMFVSSVVCVPVQATDGDEGDTSDELLSGTPDLPPTAARMWPLNPNTGFIEVPFNFNYTHYSTEEVANFLQGFRDIEAKTCIRFVKKTNQKDLIFVRDDRTGKCNSRVGRKGGRQFINFSPSCMLIRKKCVHEVIHALGFRHMHQRYDRDTVLTIQWDNIGEDDKRYFKKLNNRWEAYNTPYDLLSCMHYAKAGFSKNGENTIVSNDPAYLDSIGTQFGMSDGDATRINRMYKCPPPYNSPDNYLRLQSGLPAL